MRGSEDSPEVVVVGEMVVVVEEAGGAVETEGWEVGGTAEDEEEGEGVADSAAVGRNEERVSQQFQIEPTVRPSTLTGGGTER